jgi:hypothetical protein
VREQGRAPALPAPFERFASQVVAVEFDDGERPHVAPVSNALKQRDAIIPTSDRLAIDDARAGAQTRQRLERSVGRGV